MEKKFVGRLPGYSNLPTIQVMVATKYLLTEYYKMIKGKNEDIFEILDLPFDVYHRCPICGGNDCAQFIGYYDRGVIDENGTYYKDFPVARFLCNRKGNVPIVSHKTFSLLPHQLVPYTKYSMLFIMKVLTLRYIDDNSIMNVQTF